MNALDTLIELSGRWSLNTRRRSRASLPNRPVSHRKLALTGEAVPNGKNGPRSFIPLNSLTENRVKLLKTLLSSACERDCYYCPFRAGRDFRRATFKPQEFAELFMKLYQSSMAEGIFLSSGIAAGGANTQNKILDTAEILRNKLGFKGYLHLKIMPGRRKRTGGTSDAIGRSCVH